MSPSPSKKRQRTSWMLLVAGLLVGCLSVACANDGGAGRAESKSDEQTGTGLKDSTTSERDYSSVQIGAHIHGDLLVVDPEGRRTGCYATLAQSYEEIPNSSYRKLYVESPKGEMGVETSNLQIMRPSSGEYCLTVTGTQDSSYTLGVTFYDQSFGGKPEATDIRDASIGAGEAHSFTLVFVKTSSKDCSVVGGFDGGGESSEVDRLLTYVNIDGQSTVAESGKDSIDLFVIYGKSILPESFSASAGGENISEQFSPKAGGYDLVSLPVVAGETVVVLKVMGSNAAVSDIDSLKFLME